MGIKTNALIPEKILVIQTAFLGDVVLATALLEKLHLHYPQAAIDLLIRSGNEQVVEQHPYIRETLVWQKKKNKYRHLFGLLRQVRRNRYDLVVNIQRFGAMGLLTGFSGARKKVGFDKNPFSFLFDTKVKHRYDCHEVERNLALVEEFTGGDLAKPRLYPSPAHQEKVQEYIGKRYITLSPASVWFTKQFPAAKWIEFLNSIEEPLTVYFTGAGGDIALAEQITQGIANNRLQPVNLCGKLRVLETAALMQHAVMNYTNDSGPQHIASAMNAPVRAVFCSTVESFGFGPLSDNGRILQIQEELYCRPCGIHGRKQCPEGHFRCAMDIRFTLSD